MSGHISGLWAAMATPVDADGGVDHRLFVAHARQLLAQGCDGVMPFGTTGEGASFAGTARLAAMEALLMSGIPAERLGMGTGCPAVADTVAMTKSLLALGVVHALVLPPYFYRDAPEAGIEAAFARVIEGVGSDRLRVTAYHIPQVSGITVPAAALGRLRRRFGAAMAGVKDSSCDFAQFQAFRRAAPEVGALVGLEADIPRALAAGGQGTICGMANLVPGLVRALFADDAGAAAVAAIRDAVALLDGPFFATLKSALAAETGEDGWRNMAPPLMPVAAVQGVGIARALAALSARRAA